MSVSETRIVKFSCHAADAQQVHLAGSFNDWNATPMEMGDDGTWSVDVELGKGRYEFKFIVDGEWCCEVNCQANAECPQCIPNEFGTMNRVCEVA